MSLARYAKKRDANERPIIQALEQIGAEVWVVDRPADLLVWHRQRWHVLEVKAARGRLSATQSAEREAGMGEGIRIVRTPMEALRAVGAVA